MLLILLYTTFLFETGPSQLKLQLAVRIQSQVCVFIAEETLARLELNGGNQQFKERREGIAFPKTDVFRHKVTAVG